MITCYEENGRPYVDYVEIGDETETPLTVLSDSFLKWSRRVEATIERTSVVVPTTEVSEEIPLEETVPVLTSEELEATVATPFDEISTEHEPQDDFSQVAVAMRAELKRRQEAKTANTAKSVIARQSVVTPEDTPPYILPQVPHRQHIIEAKDMHIGQIRPVDAPVIPSPMRYENDERTQRMIQSRQLRLLKSPTPHLNDLFQERESVVVFIDGANHDATLQQLTTTGLVCGPDTFDYRKLNAFIRQQCHLLRVYYYIGLISDRPEHLKIRSRLDWMAYNNIDVKVKMAERNSQNHIVKSNVDVELAIDMYRIVTSSQEGGRSGINHVVLFSGDSDFCYPLELIKSRGVRVTVIGSLLAGTLSDKLRRTADQYIELRDLVTHLCAIQLPTE